MPCPQTQYPSKQQVYTLLSLREWECFETFPYYPLALREWASDVDSR